MKLSTFRSIIFAARMFAFHVEEQETATGAKRQKHKQKADAYKAEIIQEARTAGINAYELFSRSMTYIRANY